MPIFAETAPIAPTNPMEQAIVESPQVPLDNRRRKRMASALKGDYSPIGHPLQGIARLVEGFSRGLDEGIAAREEAAALAQERAGLASAARDTDAFLSGMTIPDQGGSAVSSSGIVGGDGDAGRVSPVVEMLGSGARRGRGQFDVKSAYNLLKRVGANDEEARTLAAIAQPESSGNPRAFNPRGKDQSYGLWQINMRGDLGPERRAKFGLRSNEDLYDPEINARVALALARDRGGYQDWTTYTSGKYRPFLLRSGS